MSLSCCRSLHTLLIIDSHSYGCWIGLRGLTRGATVTACRDTFTTGAYFTSYHMCKRKILDANDSQSPDFNQAYAELFSGGIAGTLAWALALPADVVKTRVQAEVGTTRTSMVHICRAMIQKEGFATLFRGATPLLLRAFVVNAVTFYVYEESWRAVNAVRK